MGGSLRFQMNKEVIEKVSIFHKVAKYHPKFSNNICRILKGFILHRDPGKTRKDCKADTAVKKTAVTQLFLHCDVLPRALITLTKYIDFSVSCSALVSYHQL